MPIIDTTPAYTCPQGRRKTTFSRQRRGDSASGSIGQEPLCPCNCRGTIGIRLFRLYACRHPHWDVSLAPCLASIRKQINWGQITLSSPAIYSPSADIELPGKISLGHVFGTAGGQSRQNDRCQHFWFTCFENLNYLRDNLLRSLSHHDVQSIGNLLRGSRIMSCSRSDIYFSSR